MWQGTVDRCEHRRREFEDITIEAGIKAELERDEGQRAVQTKKSTEASINCPQTP